MVFVGRPRIKDELETSGLSLSSVGGGGDGVTVTADRLHVATDASALVSCEVVLVCVKSAQSEEAGDAIARHAPPSAIVVSLQNGIGNADALRGRVDARTVLGGIVGFNVVSKGNGVFRRTTSGALVIEASADARVSSLARDLEGAGFEVELPHDIRPKQWSKLVMNLNNAISALTDVPTTRLVFDKSYSRILAAVMAEAVTVIRSAGLRVARLGPLPVSWFPHILALPSPILRALARLQIEIDPEARSSMWEDLARRRKTEVDFLNGEIVRLASSSGSKAPLNEKIVELVHQAEERNAGSPKTSADELWRALCG